MSLKKHKQALSLYKECLSKNKEVLKVNAIRNGKNVKVMFNDLHRGPQQIIMASLLQDADEGKHI